jgi:hypothetical protein
MKNRTLLPTLTVLCERYPWLSSSTEWLNVFITFMQPNNPVSDHLRLHCLVSLEAIPVNRYTLQMSIIHRHLPWKWRLNRKPRHWNSFNTRAAKPREIILTSDAIILSYWRRHTARHTCCLPYILHSCRVSDVVRLYVCLLYRLLCRLISELEVWCEWNAPAE